MIKYGYCHCGCGEKTNIASRNKKDQGWVKGEPIKYINQHALRMSPHEYIINKETGCWEWQRGRVGGYGRLTLNGNKIMAHRYYYEKKYGEISDNFQLDHLCRNRACVNPDHLEAVSCATNIQRGANSKLTMDKAEEIRLWGLVDNVSQRDIAKAYEINQSQVSRIISNEAWLRRQVREIDRGR